MKKALLLLSILFVSVFSTACINNLAVQELNNKAKDYLEKGEYTEAIERLKSSLDLDDTIFETHYNLAIAYTYAEDYLNAVAEYKKSFELNPEHADIYYSLAVAQYNMQLDLLSGKLMIDDEGNVYSPENSNKEEVEDEKYAPSKEVLAYVEDLKLQIIQNYETYLEKSPNASNKDEVLKKIEELKSEEQ